MQAALYDPHAGYYTTLAHIGPAGDYYTSSNVHPIFGELLAKKFGSLFAEMNHDEEMILLEIGAGTGRLAEDILSTLEDKYASLFGRTTYLIVESSPHLYSLQRERLGRFDNVRWVSLDEFTPDSLTAIVFSNELLDSFPVHRAIRHDHELKELYITLDGDSFTWTVGDLTNHEIARYLNETGIQLLDGQIADVAIDVVSWLGSVAGILKEGFLVTCDYGDTAERLYAPHRQEGTLRCFYRHTLTTDPLTRVGEQDITASVDFSLVMKYGERVGLETVEFKRQREVLLDLGLLERFEEIEQAPGPESDKLNARLAMKHFLMPGAFGENFKVLVQRKKTG
jgi:SAM-dependent MidA family methyltransferase